MQISRLFEIVYILLNRRHVTAKELAERFEVSVRTIYRDIDALSMAGVPVYATQGARGGIFISEDYVLNKSALTDVEQGQILLALQSLNAAGHSEGNRLLSRLGSLFDKNSADWIEVDFSRWGNALEDRLVLSQIKDGILACRCLSFTYFAGNGMQTERTVCPVKLIYKSRSWYVQAYCRARADYRTFKIVRMRDVRLLEETFSREQLPRIPLLEGETMDSAPPPKRWPVVLRFDRSYAWRVLDEFDSRCFSWDEEGNLIVRVNFPDEDWLYGYLLSFGSAAELLEPADMREHMRGVVESIYRKY